MTPQEKDLIQSVFDRLAAQKMVKDAEAEALIKARAASQPDALYGLVQAVVMLEAGLNQAQSRISELQRQVEQQGNANQGGSFLGGAPSPWASAPRPAAQQVYSAPQPAPQPVYYAAPQMAPSLAPSPWAQPSAGGSFLRNAATMAAGVAGGTLIAEGISSMLGGHHYGSGFGGYDGGYGGSFAGGGYGGPAEVVENVTVNNYYDNQSAGGHAVRDDASLQQASYDVDDSGGYDDGADI